MSFNAASLKLMADKGLSAHDIAEIAAAAEQRADPTAAERKRRQRAKEKAERDMSQRDVTCDKGSNDKDILTSKAQVSEPSGSSPSPRPWALPVGVSLQVWQDFLKNRKRKNLPNTDTAWKTFTDDLARISLQTGIPPPKLIEIAAGKGWASINDPRENKHGERSHSDRKQSGWEQAFHANMGSVGHG